MGEAEASFGPETAQVVVRTYAEGMLSPLAHDLKLQVTAFQVTVGRASDGALTVEGHFDAASLRVVAVMDGEREHASAPSKRDRKTIEKNLVKDVLNTRRHPEVVFQSTRVEVGNEGGEVTGQLSLMGRTRPVTVTVTRAGRDYVGRARLHQPDFGIKPYSAMMGTLKVKPDVDVIVTLPYASEL